MAGRRMVDKFLTTRVAANGYLEVTNKIKDGNGCVVVSFADFL